MKRRRLLLLSVLVVALLVGGCGLWVWQAKWQYALNRELIAALVHNDSKQAIKLVNAGANPNTRYNPPPTPTLKLLFNQLLHRRAVPADNSPTALMLTCGQSWYMHDDKQMLIVHPYPEDIPLVQTMLAHGADIQAIDAGHCSALHYAAARKHPSSVQLLLEHGANINQQGNNGMTPLMLAVSYNDVDTTRMLLDHGANVGLMGKWGITALNHAVSSNPNRRIIRLLLAHGADPNQHTNRVMSPLAVAQEQHLTDIIALMQKGAK